jgi:sugar transferase (PEP-CTERM system associated)
MRWVHLPTSGWRGVLCIVAESGILFLSFLAAVTVRFLGELPAEGGYPLFLPKALLAVAVFQLSLYYADLYEGYTTSARAELLVRLTRAFLAGTVALTLIFYGTPAVRFGRGIVAFFLPLGLAGIFLWRLGCLHLWGHDALRETVLILGTGPSAQDLARETLERAQLDYRIAGFLGERTSEVGRRLVNPSVIGTLDDLPSLVVRERASLIVVALDDLRGQLPVSELLRCRLAGVRVEDAATFFERLTHKILLRDLRPSWFVFSQGFNKPRIFGKTKRLLEAAAAAGVLLLLSPLLLLLALLVKLQSPGPALYRQERVGERGRIFKLHKLRTMAADAETETGPVWTRRDGDPRVTLVGRFLRKLRLDEIPQLWNVVRGEMSLVGPRPERPHFVEKLRTVIPYYDERHTVKPGITGWAQIKFGYGSNLEDAEEKLQYDLYYIKHMSWLFDLRILLHTLKIIAFGRGAR